MSSIWMRDYKDFNLSKVDKNIETSTLIIGGGIAGIITAYNLMKNNIPFILVEAEKMAKGVSANTTAQLSVSHDAIYQEIKTMHGINKAKEYYHSQTKGLNWILEIIEKENITCDLKLEDTYLYANSKKGLKTLKKEYNVLKTIKADINIIKNKRKPIKFNESIIFKNQAIFNPMKYMMSIIEILIKNNTRLYENSRVTKIKKINNYYEVMINDKQIIKCNKIIMACHYPILNPSGLYFTKIYQSASYAMAFKSNLKIDSNYTSVDAPYYTLRRYDDNTLIIGGCDHYNGIEINFKNCFKKLESKIFSLDKNAEILNRWWSEDCMTTDSLPYVDHYSYTHKNIYLITGFNKWGFTNAHTSAINITNMLLNKEHEKIYKTNRCTLIRNIKNTTRMIAHSINGLIISRILVKKTKLADIKIGKGKVLRHNKMNILAYRESTNKYIILKNKCTHLGCSLIWNDIDNVWISKCHGSIFDIHGNVLEGPALKPLERIV